MHEIVKYFILTEIQKQCLNPMPERLIGPGRPAETTHYLLVGTVVFVVITHSVPTVDHTSCTAVLQRFVLLHREDSI